MPDVDNLFSQIVAEASKKFGKEKVLPIESLHQIMCGVPCPLAWSYVIGGSSVVPCGRVIGCDGPPGMFKSSLAIEHALWFLKAGGAAVLIDTEEKISDTLVRSFLTRVSLEERRRFTYLKASSIEEAQSFVTFFKDKAKEFRKNLKPEEQFPLLIIWDSLTGSGTENQLDKISKEGFAATRSYPEQAMQIANFYKNYVVDDAFVTLLHVQHAKKNNDPYASGDDEYIPNGGLEPKYKSTYHFRMLSVKDIESKDWSGKELRLRMIKSGLGENHRKLTTRVLWQFIWCDVPVFNDDGSVKMSSDKVSYQQAIEKYAQLTMFMDMESVKKVEAAMDLANPKREFYILPVFEKKRIQFTWFDWDWSLGTLLLDLKYSDMLYSAEKNTLTSLLQFERVGKDEVICKQLFGDNEARSVEEFGKQIASNIEIRNQIEKFLCITKYKSVQEMALEEQQTAQGRRKKQ